jgi:7-carboxy-7-deazaguanine synthase
MARKRLEIVNRQKAELPDPVLSATLREIADSGRWLDVQNTWWTIQGEGPFAGMPCLFIRLAGCNLTCPSCDTDYTSNRGNTFVDDMVATVQKGNKYDLVVLTGGEPFRQNIIYLIKKLISIGKWVQIETNGTLWNPLLDEMTTPELLRLTIVCSPKAEHVHEKLQQDVAHLKYVIHHEHIHELDGLPTQVLGRHIAPARPWATFRGTIWVQPEDGPDLDKNTAACVRLCLKHGYRLSLQTHKIIGVE